MKFGQQKQGTELITYFFIPSSWNLRSRTLFLCSATQFNFPMIDQCSDVFMILEHQFFDHQSNHILFFLIPVSPSKDLFIAIMLSLLIFFFIFGIWLFRLFIIASTQLPSSYSDLSGIMLIHPQNCKTLLSTYWFTLIVSHIFRSSANT